MKLYSYEIFINHCIITVKENWERKEAKINLDKLKEASEKVKLINKSGKVTTDDVLKGLGKTDKVIVAVDFNLAGIEKTGKKIIGKDGETVLGYELSEGDHEFINIDHHFSIDEMKRKVSSTNLACDYVEKNGVMPIDRYEVVAHHADVDSLLSTLVLRGLLPADKNVREMAIMADHTGTDNALVDFLQASQEEEKIKNDKKEVNYQKTYEFLTNNLAVLLEKIEWNRLCNMESKELLKKLTNNDDFKEIDARMIKNLESRISKREEVVNLVKNIGKPGEKSFQEVREGSGVYFIDVGKEIDGELAPAVFTDNYINAKVIIISYPYGEVGDKRRATKVRLGDFGVMEKLDLQSINLNYFVKGIDKDGKQLDIPGYGGRWNAGSDKRNGGTYLTGVDYARNIDNLIRAQEDLIRFKQKISEAGNWQEGDKKAVEEGLNLMVELHLSQKDRPDKKPYIVHPLEVAEVVWRDFGVDDKNVILAALLHDSIEDQAELLRMKNGDPENIDKRRSGLDYIGKKFGSDVAGLVEELSNPEKSKKDIEKELISLGYKIEDQNFEREKNKLKNKYYLEHVKEIIEKDPRLMAIKLADFSLNALALDNVKDDPSRKAKLLVKYQPVGKLFLDKIDNPDETTKRMIEKFDSQKLSWLRDELEHLVG